MLFKIAIITIFLLNIKIIFASDANENDLKLKFHLELDEISGLTKEKAERKLNETPENVEKQLIALKELLKTETNLKIDLDDNKFLVKFLRFAKYDAQQAFERMKNYFNFKLQYKDASRDLTPSSVKQVYEQEIVQILPSRDFRGRRVVVINIGKWKPSEIPLIEFFRGIEVALEFLLMEPKTQIHGISALLNFDDISLSHLFASSPSFMGMSFEYGQNALPVRIGRVYVVNSSFIFNIVFGLMKPFMSDDLSERFVIESDDHKNLIASIGENSLEEKFGGNIKNGITFGKFAIEEAEKYNDVFKEIEIYGYDF